MYIETDRLIIRELIPTDKDVFVQMAADGTLTDIWGACESYDWMTDWIAEAIELSSYDDPWKDYLAYAIVRKEDGKVIGSVGCSVYLDLKEIGITYFIGSAYRGSGYAAEAVKAYTHSFLDWYKDIPKLIATVRTENSASCKVVEKAGFSLKETKMYKDINDSEEQEYNFYVYDRKKESFCIGENVLRII